MWQGIVGCPFQRYICLDATGRYAVVPHHCQNGHVTKLARRLDGGFQLYVEFDDAVVALFRDNDDGTIGEICDAVWRTGTGAPGAHVMSHLRSAICSPDGKHLLVCDTGNDCIATYGLDIQMPVMDGISATKAIREAKVARSRDIPIYAMTARTYKEDIDSCLDAGMNEHIAKPIDLAVLLKTLDDVFNAG